MQDYLTVNTVAETTCLIIALVCLIRDKSIAWRSQILCLAATCIAEFAGRHVKLQHQNNSWIYNIFLLFEFSFTALLFNYLISAYTRQGKYWILSALLIFVAIYTFCISTSSFYKYAYPAYIFASAVFVILGFYYYYLLLNDERYTDLKTSPAFWWVAGTLLFYFGNTACNIFDDDLTSIMIEPLNQHLTTFIYKILNIILYSFWSFSYICKKWLSTSK